MTQDQFIGITRNLLAAIGGLVIGHGLANATVWEAFGGFVLAGGSAYYSFMAHALTLDAILGVVRAAVGAGGGYIVFRGWASQDAVNQYAAIILAIVPLGWSYSAHSEISLPPNPPATGA